MPACAWVWVWMGTLSVFVWPQPLPGQAIPADSTLSNRFEAYLRALPAPVRHFEGLSEAQQRERLQQERHYPELALEKAEGRWFAALLSLKPENSLAITARFQTWNGFMDFLEEREALVDVWAYGEGGPTVARRLEASELAALKQQPREQPTFLTVTYRDPASNELVNERVEFGFQAAEQAFQASQRYRQQRELQLASRQVLSVRDAEGRLNAHSQWEAIVAARAAQRLPLTDPPAEPTNRYDLFVAFEYEV
ncbi:MAG TPA: hypothetical protein VNM37_27175, partial [Candidatus Dormibacteraeota bacterium]|nr:hypothetical protein [Candidatus Dormibacteraeota bacterium]